MNPPTVLQYLVSLLPPLLGAGSLHCPGPAAAPFFAVLLPPGTCHESDVLVQENFSALRKLTER